MRHQMWNPVIVTSLGTMYYAGTNLYSAFPANIQTTTHDTEVMIS
jgi:hypothetical protein